MQNLPRNLAILSTLGLFVFVPGASALGPSLDLGATARVTAAAELPDAMATAEAAKASATLDETQARADAALAEAEARVEASASAGGNAASEVLAKIGEAFAGLASFLGGIFASADVSADVRAK